MFTTQGRCQRPPLPLSDAEYETHLVETQQRAAVSTTANPTNPTDRVHVTLNNITGQKSQLGGSTGSGRASRRRHEARGSRRRNKAKTQRDGNYANHLEDSPLLFDSPHYQNMQQKGAADGPQRPSGTVVTGNPKTGTNHGAQAMNDDEDRGKNNTMIRSPLKTKQSLSMTRTTEGLSSVVQESNEMSHPSSDETSSIATNPVTMTLQPTMTNMAMTRIQTKSMIPCRHLQAEKICRFGDDCWFSHVIQEEEESPPVQIQPGETTRPSTALCRYIQAGRLCPFGENCWFVHEIPVEQQQHHSIANGKSEQPKLYNDHDKDTRLDIQYRTARKVAKKERREAERLAKQQELNKKEEEQRLVEYRAARNAAKEQNRQKERLAKQQQQLKQETEDPKEKQNSSDKLLNSVIKDTKHVKVDYDGTMKKAHNFTTETVGTSPLKKTKNRRKKRFEIRMREIEESTTRRSLVWNKEIEDEIHTLDLMVLMCETEMSRISGCSTTREKNARNPEAKRRLLKLCRHAINVLYEQKKTCDVTIVDMKRQHRHYNQCKGKIQYPKKRKFYVALQTKKKKTEFVFFQPGFLEPLAKQSDKKEGDHKFVTVDLFVGSLDIDKRTVDHLRELDKNEVAGVLDEWASARTLSEESQREAIEKLDRPTVEQN